MRHKDTLTEKHVQKDSQIYVYVHTTVGKQRPFLSHHIPVSPSGTEMQLQIAEDATKWKFTSHNWYGCICQQTGAKVTHIFLENTIKTTHGAVDVALKSAFI